MLWKMTSVSLEELEIILDNTLDIIRLFNNQNTPQETIANHILSKRGIQIAIDKEFRKDLNSVISKKVRQLEEYRGRYFKVLIRRAFEKYFESELDVTFQPKTHGASEGNIVIVNASEGKLEDTSGSNEVWYVKETHSDIEVYMYEVLATLDLAPENFVFNIERARRGEHDEYISVKNCNCSIYANIPRNERARYKESIFLLTFIEGMLGLTDLSNNPGNFGFTDEGKIRIVDFAVEEGFYGLLDETRRYIKEYGLTPQRAKELISSLFQRYDFEKVLLNVDEYMETEYSTDLIERVKLYKSEFLK